MTRGCLVCSKRLFAARLQRLSVCERIAKLEPSDLSRAELTYAWRLYRLAERRVHDLRVKR